MTNALAWLDHIGVLIHDLDRAARLFSSLGFTLLPPAELTRPSAGGGSEPSGAINQCVMFRQGYIELQGIPDKTRGHFMTPYLEGREGLHIIVLGCASADQAWAEARARGYALHEVQEWHRDVTAQGVTRSAGFRFSAFPTAITPEVFFCFCQHLTHDVVRPPSMLVHHNGATRLRAVELCVADVAEAETRFARLTGWTPSRGGFDLQDGSRIGFVTTDAVRRRFPDAPAAPSFVSATIECDPEAVARHAERAGVPITRDGAAVVVAPEHGCGAIWRFVGA
jgi:hypothetical protein